LFASHATGRLVGSSYLSTSHLKICLFISLSFNSLQIKLFKILEFTHLSGTLDSTLGSFRELRHLVHAFNIPFAIFKEFINIFTKHLFKVSIFFTSTIGLSLLLSCLSVFHPLDVVERFFLQSCFTLLRVHQFRSLRLTSASNS